MPFPTTERRLPRPKTSSIPKASRRPASSSTTSSPPSSQESGDWNFGEDEIMSDSPIGPLLRDDIWLKSGLSAKQKPVEPVSRSSAMAKAIKFGSGLEGASDLPFRWEVDLAEAARRTQNDLEANLRYQDQQKFAAHHPKASRTVFEPTRGSQEFTRFLPTASPSFPAVDLLRTTDFDSIMKRARRGDEQRPATTTVVATPTTTAIAAKDATTLSVSPTPLAKDVDSAEGPSDGSKKKKKRKNKKKKTKSGALKVGKDGALELAAGQIELTIGDPAGDDDTGGAALAAEPSNDVRANSPPTGPLAKKNQHRKHLQSNNSGIAVQRVSVATSPKSTMSTGTSTSPLGVSKPLLLPQGDRNVKPASPELKRFTKPSLSGSSGASPAAVVDTLAPTPSPAPMALPSDSVSQTIVPAKTLDHVASVAATEVHILNVSERLPTALYGPLLEEILGLGYELEGISRRSNYFGMVERMFKQSSRKPGIDEWKTDFRQVTRFSMIIQLRKSPGVVALTASRCLESLRSFILSSISSPVLTSTERAALQSCTADEMFRVSRDVKTAGSHQHHDMAERSLPPKEKSEARISRADVFYTDPELPQVVFLAARISFATPILKKLLDAANRFELLGVKYLKEIDMDRAKYLTPYQVGDSKWMPSLEHITRKGESAQGWIMLVVRKSNAFEKVDDIVDSYLKSYLSISEVPVPETSKLGRRRRNQGHKEPKTESVHKPAAESGHFDTLEELKLNVLVSANVESCYQQMTMFFRDSELVPGGTQNWEDQAYHPPWYLHDPYITKTLLDHPTFLSTVCIVQSALFPQIGSIMDRMRKEEFDIAGMKIMRLNVCMARKVVKSEEEMNKYSPDALERYYNDLTAGPVAVFLLQRTNAIKRWADVMPDFVRTTGLASKPGSIFQGGMVATMSHRQAYCYRVTLFPEGPTVKLRYWRGKNKFEKSLQPGEHVTEVSHLPRVLTSNLRRRDLYVSAPETSPSTPSTTTARDQSSSIASPPPTPTTSECDVKDPPELVCLTLLPGHLNADLTYKSWATILNVVLMDSGSGKEANNGGAASGVASTVDVAKSVKKGGAGSKKRRKAQIKAATTNASSTAREGSGDCTGTKSRDRSVSLDKSTVSSSTVRASTPEVSLAPPRLVACRYVIAGNSAIDEWLKYRPESEQDPTDGREDTLSWPDRLRSDRGTSPLWTPHPTPYQLIQRGACLAVALEADRCGERVKAIIDALPPADRACVAYTTTCEEACGQLPVFFGELFESSYKIVLERRNSTSLASTTTHYSPSTTTGGTHHHHSSQTHQHQFSHKSRSFTHYNSHAYHHHHAAPAATSPPRHPPSVRT
ncbi:hypothetical protein DFS34DRAFT_252013 [Phlyctochytrium arcticum]|nr:hypothetical protein DFS34DRAFT_252013 [Phlyctochytrium arcticum]